MEQGFQINGYWFKFKPGHFEYLGGCWRYVYDDEPPAKISFSTTTNVPGEMTVSNTLNGL